MQITTTIEIMQVITDILREVFEDDTLVAREDMTAADVEKWDSLSQIDLVLTVERRFGVKLTSREVTSLKNVGELTHLVLKKLGTPAEHHSP